MAHPAHQLAAHREMQMTVKISAGRKPKPFRRPHSQLAAAIRIKVNNAKGSGGVANNAGKRSANKTKAVMMRCLSMKP
jgi:hypothetical protein